MADNGFNYDQTISAEGDHVAFATDSTNLVPADSDILFDVYVKDATTGAVTLASTGPKGKGNEDSRYPSLSADGGKISFSSAASNLSRTDRDYVWDVYVKDLASGTIVLASTSSGGTKSNGHSGVPSLSGDGSIVAFASSATNLDPSDTDSTADIYAKDLTTGFLTLASVTKKGRKADAYSADLVISADGTKVAFLTAANNLDPRDRDGIYDIYVKDLSTGRLTLVSVSDAGVKGNGPSTMPSISADGRYVAFASSANNLDPGDTDKNPTDVYVKDLLTGDLILASTSAEGIKGDDDSTFPSLSADGRLVAFGSQATNLHPADPDRLRDIFVKDLVTGEVRLASTSDTGEKGNDYSSEPKLSGGGASVAFGSAATNLDPADTDWFSDIYLKRLA